MYFCSADTYGITSLLKLSRTSAKCNLSLILISEKDEASPTSELALEWLKVCLLAPSSEL